MEAKIYNQKAKVVGTMELPEGIFGLPWNADLVHQVTTSSLTSKRANTAQAKDRGAVRGGGKKPWRQKGTGRARHGSIRSPLWKGGGATHGPTVERNYERKINRSMKHKALRVVLSQKFRDGEVVLVEGLEWPAIKTKQAVEFLKGFGALSTFPTLSYRTGKRTLVALPKRSEEIAKSFRNLKSVQITELRNLNALDLLAYRYVMFVDPQTSLTDFTKRLEKKHV